MQSIIYSRKEDFQCLHWTLAKIWFFEAKSKVIWQHKMRSREQAFREVNMRFRPNLQQDFTTGCKCRLVAAQNSTIKVKRFFSRYHFSHSPITEILRSGNTAGARGANLFNCLQFEPVQSFLPSYLKIRQSAVSK